VKCLERDYSYEGAEVHIVVDTSSSSICSEVHSSISRGVDGVMEFLRSHGGCYITSEKPLIVKSGDGSVTVTVSPKNFIANLFWHVAVNRAKSVCTE